jgi:uncharacterized damage-inducible protein DinB
MPSLTLTELLHGKGAHADPIACVEDLDAELAARTVAGFPHSIFQIIFHMTYWMDYELRRIRGQQPAYPEHNSESFPEAASPLSTEEWYRLKTHLTTLLAEFTVLANSSSEEMHRKIESVHEGDKKLSGSLEAVLWQMVAHNSYHTGQMAMIRRSLGAWPPKAGGDTW